jgi:hypothetical protein
MKRSSLEVSQVLVMYEDILLLLLLLLLFLLLLYKKTSKIK